MISLKPEAIMAKYKRGSISKIKMENLMLLIKRRSTTVTSEHEAKTLSYKLNIKTKIIGFQTFRLVV